VLAIATNSGKGPNVVVDVVELSQMKKNDKNATSYSVQKEKHLVGRPIIQHNVRTLNEHKIKRIMKARNPQNEKRNEAHIKIGFNLIFGPKY
jgi:hypothetical protein